MLAAGHESHTATCPMVTSAIFAKNAVAGRSMQEKEEEEKEQEEKRQADLRHAKGQLQKCLEEEDYAGAAAAKANLAKFMNAAPCSQRKIAVAPAGKGPQTAAGHTAALATSAVCLASTRIEEEAKEKGGQHQEELRRIKDEVKKCLGA